MLADDKARSVDFPPPSSQGLTGASSDATPQVSILVPAYNEERNIGPLLTLLADIPLLPGGRTVREVRVDVSGSSDGTRSIVESVARKRHTVSISDIGSRDGLVRALDRLIRSARGTILVRVDADIRFSADTLLLMTRHLSDPRVGIVGPRVEPTAGQNRRVTRISAVEWALHHEMCMQVPKTTLVQVFRHQPITLRPDAGAEDSELQSRIEERGLRAVYEPAARVYVAPPATIRAFLSQRVRTVQALGMRARRGYPMPSTTSFRLGGRALFNLLRRRSAHRLVDVAAFIVLEAFARLGGRLKAQFTRSETLRWEPVEGTKAPDWYDARRILPDTPMDSDAAVSWPVPHHHGVTSPETLLVAER